jgi:hypothetical protein
MNRDPGACARSVKPQATGSVPSSGAVHLVNAPTGWGGFMIGLTGPSATTDCD